MDRITLLIVSSSTAVLASVVAILTYRAGGRRSLLWTWIGATVLTEAFVLWDRARKAGTPFRYDEPAWVTALAVAIPIAAIMAAVRWTATRGLHAGLQLLLAIIVGVVAFYASALVLYIVLVGFF